MEKAKPLSENGRKVVGLNSEMHDKWMENFANMLIKESVEAVVGFYAENGDSACDEIKEHFGVE